MAPKPSGKAAKGSKSATGSTDAASSSTVAPSTAAGGLAGAGADQTTLLRLYKRCMDDNGKPREKLTSLGAAEKALQEMQTIWRGRTSRLACLLVVRQTSSLFPMPVSALR